MGPHLGRPLKIVDPPAEDPDIFALAQPRDNGKPIRETAAADIPLSIDHLRYFAGVLRSRDGTMSEIGADIVADHFHGPRGVVGQIIPWNFSILMAAWKLPSAAPSCRNRPSGARRRSWCWPS